MNGLALSVERCRTTQPEDRERLRASLVEDLVTAHQLIGKKPRK